MLIGQKYFDFNNTVYIMGILNVTPDSFSDGGKYDTVENAVAQAVRMEREGAAIIDVGGESTRPGHKEVSVNEEISRVVPVIKALQNKISVPLSIDTSKAKVAEAAIKAGVSLINDVWGFKKDVKMAEVAAHYDVPCCLMHNREKAVYNDTLWNEIKADLMQSVNIALSSGVKKGQIILDPGIGFGKTVEHNLTVMKHLEEMNTLGFPWLLGASRKSMIGKTLDLPVTERLEGTLVTTIIGIQKGASLIRVHDVKENIRALKMLYAIQRADN